MNITESIKHTSIVWNRLKDWFPYFVFSLKEWAIKGQPRSGHCAISSNFVQLKKKPWSNLTRIPIAVIMFTIKKSTSQKKVVVGMSKHNCTDYSNNSMLMPKEQEVFPSDLLRSKNAVIANTLIKGHQKSSMWKYMFAKLTLWPTVKNQH